LDGDAFSSELDDFCGCIFRFGLRAVVMNYDIGAFGGQADRYGSADALGSSGD
jgi:hypothetical protein